MATGNVVLPGDLAGERHEPDLGPAGAEIDGEDEAARPGSGGRAGRPVAARTFPSVVRAHDGSSWLSIMSAMTARMNSSASSVMPPATPP